MFRSIYKDAIVNDFHAQHCTYKELLKYGAIRNPTHGRGHILSPRRKVLHKAYCFSKRSYAHTHDAMRAYFHDNVFMFWPDSEYLVMEMLIYPDYKPVFRRAKPGFNFKVEKYVRGVWY